MKRFCIVLGIVVLSCMPVFASPVIITAADSFDFTTDYSLVGSKVSDCVPVVSNPLNNVQIISAAYYSSTADSYLYLYQLINNNVEAAVLHRLSVTDFVGLGVDTQIGYIDANPGVFLAGTAVPLVGDASPAVATVGFYVEVLAAETSKVMYVTSTLAPSDAYATALVQNSGQANGLVIVPTAVPEPATLALLGLGGLLLGKRKK